MGLCEAPFSSFVTVCVENGCQSYHIRKNFVELILRSCRRFSVRGITLMTGGYPASWSVAFVPPFFKIIGEIKLVLH